MAHLARRFTGSLSPRPPSPVDDAWACSQLLPGEQDVWRAMANQDRRHSVAVARRLLADMDADAPRAVVAGALLHDCGKTAAGLGTFGRVGATLWIGFVGRARAAQGDGRIARYCRHEPVGAVLLAAAGSDPVTVALVAGSTAAPPLALSALRAADDI
jgi:hypothetical protein